jgi:opacity protein-like surface antigen
MIKRNWLYRILVGFAVCSLFCTAVMAEETENEEDEISSAPVTAPSVPNIPVIKAAPTAAPKPALVPPPPATHPLPTPSPSPVAETPSHKKGAVQQTTSKHKAHRAYHHVAGAPKETAIEPAPQAQANPWHTVFTIGLGPAWVQAGNKRNLFFPDGSNSHFVPRHSETVQKLLDAYLGGMWQLRPHWEMQAGFAYSQPNSFTIEGYEHQSSSPTAYNYYYNVAPRQFLLEFKSLYQYREIVHPYVSLGAGMTFNSVYDYESTPPNNILPPTFSYHANYSFSYAVGLGVDVDVMQQVRLGVGYRFTDFGEADLGHGTQNGVMFPGTINQSHLYMNALMAQLTILGV